MLEISRSTHISQFHCNHNVLKTRKIKLWITNDDCFLKLICQLHDNVHNTSPMDIKDGAQEVLSAFV